RPEEGVEEPLVGRQLRAVRRHDPLAPLDHEQGAARHGVEWLDPALGEHGKVGERLHGGRLGLGHGKEAREGAHRGGEDDEHGHRAAHAASLLLLANPARWIRNWITSPRVIAEHAMYGTSQLGLRTTCRTVVWSLFSNPAW